MQKLKGYRYCNRNTVIMLPKEGLGKVLLYCIYVKHVLFSYLILKIFNQIICMRDLSLYILILFLLCG